MKNLKVKIARSAAAGLVIALVCLLAFSGCGGNLDDSRNPLEISGCRFYDKTINSAGDMRLLAKINGNARIGDEYLHYISVPFISDETVTVSCRTSSQPVSDDYSDTPTQGEPGTMRHISIAREDMSIQRELSLDPTTQVLTSLGEADSVLTTCDGSGVIDVYTTELDKVYTIENLPSDAIFTTDGKRAYYVEDRQIARYDCELKLTEALESNISFYAESLFGVITAEDGEDYVLFIATGADLRQHEFIMRADTGEIVSAYSTDMFTETRGNVYLASAQDGDQCRLVISSSQEVAYDYTWSDSSFANFLYVLSDRSILFANWAGNELYFGLYDSLTGEQIASTRVKDSKVGHSVWLEAAPVYLDPDTLLITFYSYDNSVYFVSWDLTGHDEIFEKMQVERHTPGSFDFPQSLDGSLPAPGEVGEEHLPLREKANELEEKYQVEIRIGEECNNIIDVYAIKPLADYGQIELALNTLDEQMARYPDNFFAQLEHDGEPLLIYLSGELISLLEEIDNAGGLFTYYGSQRMIIVDSQSADFLHSSFHHEICHAIEDRMKNTYSHGSEPDYDSEKLNAFNPTPDMYLYFREEAPSDEDHKYFYTSIEMCGGDLENACFVSQYSLNSPGEDMATIFESVMSDRLLNIDFSKSPALRGKLNYFCECMRGSFDTSGWGEVPWEAYMD